MSYIATEANDVAKVPTPIQHLTNDSTRAALRIQNQLISCARDVLREEDFVELLLPIIGPVTDPGTRGAKQVDIDYYGHAYKLMSSGILYKQASLATFERIFTVAPNVRLEPLETATTHRHLAEFHQLDIEMAGATREDAIRLAEKLLVHMVRRVVTENHLDLKLLGRDTSLFNPLLDRPFDQITHDAAVTKLHDLGHGQSAATEIDWQAEELISRNMPRPFFVLDYPKGSRGFYDKVDPERTGVLRNFDLLVPEGFGELCSGGEREFRHDAVITRMRESGEDPDEYEWYLNMAQSDGVPASAGFGMGVERLTRYVCGLSEVWQATAYPKTPGAVSP